MALETKRFVFGAYTLDSKERVLFRAGEMVPVPPKILELLLVLVENHGHVVGKSELIERLWADTYVEESNLTFSIRKLRKILDDDAHDPKFVETIPKRGYRFIAPTAYDSDVHEKEAAVPADRQIGLRRGLGIRRTFAIFIGGVVLLGALAAIYVYIPARSESQGTDWTGARNVPLTDLSGTEYFPSMSPDGKSFVYAADHGGDFDIYLQRVGGRNTISLTKDGSGDDTQPSFSPDGSRIAFRSERDGGGIFVMEASGENPRRISDFGYHPAWSPDGRNLVVSSFARDRITVSEPGPQGLSIIDLQTGEKREIHQGLASLPSWSPNGKRIAFWHYGNVSGQSDVATIPSNGGEPVAVAKGFGSLNWNPVWSPDGKFLYFVSNRGGSQGFWRVRIDQETGASLSEPEPVGTPSKFSRHLSFSRDETRMIYVQTNLQSNIQGVEFDPEKRTIVGSPFWITQGDREVSRAELSSDGTRFQMRLIRRTQDDIVTVSRDGTDWQDITDDAAFDRYSRWSPDGRHIAFTSDRSGDSEVWMCRSDGTNLRQVTFKEYSGQRSRFPLWSPDGSRIAYSSPTHSYVMDPFKPQNEQEQQKLPQPVQGQFVPWDWSPDGKKLAGMFRSPNSGGGIFFFETGKFIGFSDSSDAYGSWLPDSRHLVYSEENRVMIFDSATLQSRELITTPIGVPRSPFIGKDGRLLYYVLHQNESDIWMLDRSSSN